MARNLFGTLTVLVVDDSNHMRKLIQGLLYALGVGSIVLASDGEDAWSKFLKHKPDVVITDAAMAPMDGFGLARRLREAQTQHMVPIIMISAHTELSAIQKARDVGITEFIRKPLAARALYERLIAVVNRPLDNIAASHIAAEQTKPVAYL
jgi:DNA-binding response OmpR family regulator